MGRDSRPSFSLLTTKGSTGSHTQGGMVSIKSRKGLLSRSKRKGNTNGQKKSLLVQTHSCPGNDSGPEGLRKRTFTFSVFYRSRPLPVRPSNRCRVGSLKSRSTIVKGCGTIQYKSRLVLWDQDVETLCSEKGGFQSKRVLPLCKSFRKNPPPSQCQLLTITSDSPSTSKGPQKDFLNCRVRQTL